MSNSGGLFSLFFFFIIGALCGFFFRVGQRVVIFRYMYYLSIYPIVMSIFQDQFFSLLSFWVQFFLLMLFFYYLNKSLINDRYNHSKLEFS